MDTLNNKLSDGELFELCRKYGQQALAWRRKFIGLLPEVNQRELYKKRGFASVFEFAARLAGVSREQVERVLGLERKFENLPILKKLLVNGEVSTNKLARVSGIANPENQEFLANQARLLPNRALETLVRDEKNAHDQVVHVHGTYTAHRNINNVKFGANELLLSDAVKQKLLELQNKGININEMISGFLEKREEEIEREKQEIARLEKEKYEHESGPGRYIPAKTRKILHEEHGKKCSIQNCRKEATEIHHAQRFSLGKTHDPRFMAPFCHEHHQIAHSIDVKVQEKRHAAVF